MHFLEELAMIIGHIFGDYDGDYEVQLVLD